jgi:hypothetical protein
LLVTGRQAMVLACAVLISLAVVQKTEWLTPATPPAIVNGATIIQPATPPSPLPAPLRAEAPYLRIVLILAPGGALASAAFASLPQRLSRWLRWLRTPKATTYRHATSRLPTTALTPKAP